MGTVLPMTIRCENEHGGGVKVKVGGASVFVGVIVGVIVHVFVFVQPAEAVKLSTWMAQIRA